MENNNHRILQKSLEALEIISLNPEGRSLVQICNELEMPKSSMHILLQTFVNLGYVNKNEHTNIYTLGVRSFEIGSRYVEGDQFLGLGKEILEKVSREVDETAHLATLDDTDVVYIFKYESTQPIRMVSNVGRRNPAHATALGKALLSGLTDEEIKRRFNEKKLVSLTENTVTDLSKLLNQIADIRCKGIALEKEESTPNIQCFAVPIKKRDGTVIAAMSISIPVFRINEDTAFYTNALMNGKLELEKNII